MTTTTRDPLTRDVVVAAARSLISAEGLDAVSLRRLAGSLGVTAPALYAYVDDKRDLLRGVAASAFEELLARFDEVSTPSPVDRVRAYSRAYIMFAVENPALFRTMFLFPPGGAFGGPTGEELPAATRAFESSLRAVEDAIASGEFTSADAVTTGLILWTVTHGTADVLLMGFAPDTAARDALIDSVLDTAIAGLRT